MPLTLFATVPVLLLLLLFEEWLPYPHARVDHPVVHL
jgi:hypothetical protein